MLTEQEIKAIEQEAECLYPNFNWREMLPRNWPDDEDKYNEQKEAERAAHISATIKEREKVKELEGLVKKAFDLSVCDLPEDEQEKYWNEFKSENNI